MYDGKKLMNVKSVS